MGRVLVQVRELRRERIDGDREELRLGLAAAMVERIDKRRNPKTQVRLAEPIRGRGGIDHHRGGIVRPIGEGLVRISELTACRFASHDEIPLNAAGDGFATGPELDAPLRATGAVGFGRHSSIAPARRAKFCTVALSCPSGPELMGVLGIMLSASRIAGTRCLHCSKTIVDS